MLIISDSEARSEAAGPGPQWAEESRDHYYKVLFPLKTFMQTFN